MEWRLPSQVTGSGEDTLFYYNFAGNLDNYFLQLLHAEDDEFTTVLADASYQARVTGHYIAQTQSVGFTLRGLTHADAGTYGCRHRYLSQALENFTPVLFIYGKWIMFTANNL